MKSYPRKVIFLLASLQAAILLTGIYFICFSIKAIGSSLIVLVPLISLAILWKHWHPLYRRNAPDIPNFQRRTLKTLFVLTIIGVVSLLLMVTLGILDTVGYPFSGKLSTFSNRYWVRSFSEVIPPQATDIVYRGHTGFTSTLTWRCQVPEKDFLNFAEKRRWQLTDHLNEDWSHLLEMPDKPDSVWVYQDVYRNFGGYRVIYDRRAGVMYGNYSNR